MYRKKPGVDIIMDILEEAMRFYPESEFIRSLQRQYIERGGLSKKQLQGLYGKAEKITSIPAAKMATLEAIILKKHVKNRSALPEPVTMFEQDESDGQLINAILEKFPSHKRVLFFQSKYHNRETLSAAEKTELKNFYKLLIEKSKK